jgi:molybdopterin-guanine dinucleotide biosynthesis protein A
LAAIREDVEAAFVTGCDVPFLVPDLVRELVRRVEGYDVVVPVEGDRHHPLAAVYRTAVLPEVEKLLAAGRLRPVFLYDSVRTKRVPVADLRTVDPDLRTLANLNHPVDYLSALAEAGFDLPEDLRIALEETTSRP